WRPPRAPRSARRPRAARRPPGSLRSGLRAPLDLLGAPALLLLDVLVVGVVRAVGLLMDAPHLDARAATKWRPPRPLHSLGLARHLEDPESVEQLVHLTVGAVGDDRVLGVEVHHRTLVSIGEALAAQHHPGIHHLLVVLAHRG